jgi:hypothetical protein
LTFDDEVLAWVRDALHASHAGEKGEHEAAIGWLRAEYESLSSDRDAADARSMSAVLPIASKFVQRG